ncbi:MAG: PHP domain-containing protein [bacterium]|nr:PHP domain-containing protein [bacterium]
MDGMIDLHAHTTASDGTLTPKQLAWEAKKAGLTACAITDHDTVAGVKEFLAACGEAGVEGVPGVEISAKYSGEMHILGLYTDYENEGFLKKLYRLEHSREIRNKKMIERCCELGFEITEEEVLACKASDYTGSIGRPHIAQVFINRGYAKDKNEAFEKYLKKGKCCYVGRELYTPGDTISMIKEAGGIAVLAHPIYISRDYDKLYEIISELKHLGLDGVECRYWEYDNEFTEMITELCERLGMLKSGGSDFHGGTKPGLMLGCGMGNLRVPYEYLENMKNTNRRL